MERRGVWLGAVKGGVETGQSGSTDTTEVARKRCRDGGGFFSFPPSPPAT